MIYSFILPTLPFLVQENKTSARALWTISVVMSVALVASKFHRYEEWSFAGFIGFESYYTRSTFSVWKPTNWSNKTQDMWDEYRVDVSPVSIVLGVLGASATFVGWLQEHIPLDVTLLLSFSVRQHVSRFVRIIQDENVSQDKKWEEYEKIQNLCDTVNDTFQYFLPLTHLNNLLLISYFLLGAIQRNGYVFTVLLGLKSLKILVAYCVASATAHKVIIPLPNYFWSTLIQEYWEVTHTF